MSKLSILVIVASCAAVAGCSTQQMQPIATVACQGDPLAYSALKTGSVVATIVDPATVAAVSLVNVIDAPVHAAIVDACAKAQPGSVPVPGTVNVVSVPVAPPVSQTTAVILPVSAPNAQ